MRSPFGMSAAELRQRAMVCAAKAAEAKDLQAREALLRKRAGLLALADTEDWLNGQRPLADKIPLHKIPTAAPAE
jgi:hypothetical protein